MGQGKKQPRSRRKLIGKLDEDTGEIVPTGKSGRKKGSGRKQEENGSPEPITEHIRLIAEKDGKRQIIGVYKRSAACDIVQLEHLDNQIDAKVPSYLRF